MSAFRSNTQGCRAAALLLVAILGVAPAGAAFEVVAGTERISERGEVPKLLVGTAEGQFGFMVPPGWHWQGGNGEPLVQMIDPSEQGSLTIRFLPDEEGNLTNDMLQARVEKIFTGTEVLERFECASRDGEGPGLEARFAAGSGAEYRVRMAQLRYPGLVVEVQLTGPAETFGRLHTSWTYVMNSLGRQLQ